MTLLEVTTALPDTNWTPLTIPNPNRKWYQFWKPKFVWNPENSIVTVLTEYNEIMSELPWTEK